MAEPENYLTADKIMEDGCLPDAVKLDTEYRKHIYTPTERDLDVANLRRSGESLVAIAQKYHISPQYVGRIIKKLRKNGIFCSPADDIRHPRENPATPYTRVDKEVLTTLIRDYQIYAAKQQWSGTPAEFNHAMSQKYGISAQRVRNVVALIKRYLRLKQEIFIYEDVEYKSLEEVYREIYSEYIALKNENPRIPQSACATILAEKHGFTPMNIDRIIRIMTTEIPEEYFSKKRRLSTVEAFKRDKALFIDYMRYPGKRSDFCRYASQKYGVSYQHVCTTLKYCLYADPKRFDMV